LRTSNIQAEDKVSAEDIDTRFADTRFADTRFADTRFADTRFADTRFADTRFADERPRGAKQCSAAKYLNFFFVILMESVF
jgi:hypothetical protein